MILLVVIIMHGYFCCTYIVLLFLAFIANTHLFGKGDLKLG